MSAWAVAAQVADPELPMLTLADLGVLREVSLVDGKIMVSITPTYTGCPAVRAMREDIVRALSRAGYHDVEVRTVLRPPWTSDWISEQGRRKLAEAGIAPPGPVAAGASAGPRRRGKPPAEAEGERVPGPVPLTLAPVARRTPCPRCGSPDTEEVSRFGATACTSLCRCLACREPFEHVKEI